MFYTAKNSKCFSLVIPSAQIYVPLVRRYVIEILACYKYDKEFLYQVEIVIDELCRAISQEVKQKTAIWLNINFEIGKHGFSFNILEQKNREDEIFAEKVCSVLDEYGIFSPEYGLIERYLDSARLELKNGKITKVRMVRAERVD